MTTDPEEGYRQVVAMNVYRQMAAMNAKADGGVLTEFKVGDRVRLKAGGHEMTVARVEDYGNQIVCRRVWQVTANNEQLTIETHSRASLVHCDPPAVPE